MKTIEKIEKIKNKDIRLEEVGINRTFYWAYLRTQDTTNETIDFNDVVWETDIIGIIKNCHEFDIDEITISSAFSGLLNVLAKFEEQGCKILGLTKVTNRFIDCFTSYQYLALKVSFEILINDIRHNKYSLLFENVDSFDKLMENYKFYMK